MRYAKPILVLATCFLHLGVCWSHLAQHNSDAVISSRPIERALTDPARLMKLLNEHPVANFTPTAVLKVKMEETASEREGPRVLAALTAVRRMLPHPA